MRDLNWDLLQLQRRAGEDGSHGTRRDRSYALAQMANALHDLGHRGLRAEGLKPRHVEALVRHWRDGGLSDATMMNRMAHVRWWADRVGKGGMVEPTPTAASVRAATSRTARGAATSTSRGSRG